jgi:hypothetical protein
MAELLLSGRLIDIILLLVALEIVFLHSLRSRGAPALATLLPNLLAGACLLLALRLALGQASWVWLALALAASLVAHLLDLRQRWRSSLSQLEQRR